MTNQTEKDPTKVYLRNVRLSFPDLFRKTASVEGGRERFRASFIIEPETTEGKKTLKRLRAARVHVEREVFGREVERYKDNRCAIRDGDDCIAAKTGEPYAGYGGNIIVSASSDRRPTTLGRGKAPVAEEDDVLYGGCFVDAIIRLYGVKSPDKGGVGLFANLEGVMFRADGERFSAATPVTADDFEDVEDEDEDEDDDLG